MADFLKGKSAKKKRFPFLSRPLAKGVAFAAR
jgi:hypothetical protein